MSNDKFLYLTECMENGEEEIDIAIKLSNIIDFEGLVFDSFNYDGARTKILLNYQRPPLVTNAVNTTIFVKEAFNVIKQRLENLNARSYNDS